MGDICTDNRFEVIEKYKQKLIKATNIEQSPKEMEVLDNILFRFWQMGWLKAEVDAEPVRHAHWVWKGDEGDSRFMCSECGGKENVPTCMGVPDIWEYCPNCGARMEEYELERKRIEREEE